MTLLAFLLVLAGFGAFGLSTEAHFRRWIGGRVTKVGKGVLRGGAWIALAAAFAATIADYGWVFGPVAWTGLVMAGAGVVFLFLNLAPARLDR